jgi:hypothetical protein
MRFTPAALSLALALTSVACAADKDDLDNKGPAKLVSIEVAALTTLMPLNSVDLSATGTYDDGTTNDLSTMVTWSSSNPSVATIEGRKLRVLTEGSAEISAKLGELTSTTPLTVEPAVVKEVVLSHQDVGLNRGEQVFLSAKLVWSNGLEEEATERVTWSSSNEKVATVDAVGGVSTLAGGEVQITATFGDKSASTGVFISCAYPEGAPSDILWDDTFPNIYWSTAFNTDGAEMSFGLEDVHCSPEWSGVSAVFFVISAGWCPNCPAYVDALTRQKEEIEAAGGRMVFVEVQDTSYQPGRAADGVEWLESHGFGLPFITVGDKPGEIDPPRIFNESPMVVAFPSTIVVRRSDMRIIADQMRSGYYLPFSLIAQYPDLDWSDPDNVVVQTCQPGQDEASEPNNRPFQAGDLEAGVLEGGICDSEVDYFDISVEGRYRLTLEFDEKLSDLDIYVYDAQTARPLEVDGVPVGSYGGTGVETFEHAGRATIRIEGSRNRTASYRLTLETL